MNQERSLQKKFFMFVFEWLSELAVEALWDDVEIRVIHAFSLQMKMILYGFENLLTIRYMVCPHGNWTHKLSRPNKNSMDAFDDMIN